MKKLLVENFSMFNNKPLILELSADIEIPSEMKKVNDGRYEFYMGDEIVIFEYNDEHEAGMFLMEKFPFMFDYLIKFDENFRNKFIDIII